MKIAVISDIHANIHALRAVLADLEQKAVDQICCAGDLVGYAPFPNEVIALLRARGIPTVMGNYDDTIGHRRLVCGCDYIDGKAQALGQRSIAWTGENVTEENREFLRALPAEIRFTAGSFKVLTVHGSPRRLNEYLHRDTPPEYLQQLLDEAGADVLVCGHTHVPYHIVTGRGKHVVNAGSVGKPKHGDALATYVILDLGESVEVSIQKTFYDVESAARAVEEAGLPGEFADMLRRGAG